MLWQLHWQFRDGTTEMKAQRDLNESHINEMRIFVRETCEAYPIPKGVVWMACNKESEHFTKGILNETYR